MNAVIATPVVEQRLTLEPTRSHPRKLVMTRHADYVHAALMVRVGKTTQSLGWLASHEPNRVCVSALDGRWSLHIGGGAFGVSEKEANRLRDEFGIAVRETR